MCEIRLGDVAFHPSTEIWTVSVSTGGNTVWLTCRMPTYREQEITAVLSVRSPAEPCPTAPAEEEMLHGSETRVETLPADAVHGLEFMIAETHLGRRNYVPPHVSAYTVYEERSYHLLTMGAVARRSSIWEIPDAALRELCLECKDRQIGHVLAMAGRHISRGGLRDLR